MQILILFFLTTIATAQEWRRGGEKFNFNNDEIVFSNRAFCASRAKFPTKSVFLLIDNVNIAKAAFRLAKIKGIDPVATTNLASQKFRYTIFKLISLISHKLITGQLSLVEDSKVSFDYLKSNWDKSGSPSEVQALGCAVVRKWGSLHAYLNVSKPDRRLLEEIAKDLESVEETFSGCDNLSSSPPQEVDLLRFQMNEVKNFNEKGFDFWYSLKVYLSWAFRYSQELRQLAAPFDHLFRSADLEEMLVFFSSGCESLARPECTEGQLNLDSFRDFTLSDDIFRLARNPRNAPLSQNPTASFFSNPLPLKEDDLLHLTQYSTTQAWVENFRNNLVQTRGLQKIRLSSALSRLDVIQRILSADEFLDKIRQESLLDSEEWRRDFFYLCSEFNISAVKYFTNLGPDITKLSQLGVLHDLGNDLALDNVSSALTIFETLSPGIVSLCSRLEKNGFWKDSLPDKSGFAAWYLQLTRDEIVPFGQEASLSCLPSTSSFVRLNGSQTFCKSAVHCARIFLDSLFTLNSLSRSFSSLISDEIPAANLGNPYSSHVACGAYDPWAKRNKMFYQFFHDLGQAALFGSLPTPVYVSADVEEKKLVSFKELIKEGKVYFDPQFHPRSIGFSLISDLGPLLGIPCSLSISGHRVNPFEYYTFNGISFSGCLENSRNDTSVGEGDILSSSSTRNACAACAINLKTLASSASVINPALRVSAFLVKAFLRLSSNLKDPHDLPKSWRVSAHKVLLSYRYHGEIDKKCARLLLKGRSCLPQSCQREMLESFTRQFDASPVSSSFNCFLDKGIVMIKECKNPVHLSSSVNLKVETTCALKRRTL
jgi:hypothetical protein